MKITKLAVKGFGVWKDLELDGFSDQISVFYGPNEAGKTTLLHFVRAILYGFSRDRRQRYFPPLAGGRAGGSLTVSGANGSFEICRFASEQDSTGLGDVEVIAADGTVQGQSLVDVLLAGIDEPIYNNVFAVGLREIQELATLNDTDAAGHLYALSSGLDRVSLLEVLRELDSSRQRILSSEDRPSQITKLLEERERLQLEIHGHSTQTHRWLRLASETGALDKNIARLKECFERTEQQKKVAAVAGQLYDTWAQRQELAEKIHALGPLPKLSPKSLEKLDRYNLEIQKRKDRCEEIKREWQSLRDEAISLPINEKLRRQAARIEAFGEQQSWIDSLVEQSEQFSREVDNLETGLAEDRKELGLQQGQSIPEMSSLVIKKLRSPARTVRDQRQDMVQAEQKAQACCEEVDRAKTELEVALGAHGSGDLLELLETSGNLVSMLRRRVQLQERLEQLNLYRTELEDQCHRLLERRVLPTSVLAGLGGVFALGVMLILTAVFGSAFAISGAFGWSLAVLGLGGIGTAIAAKFYLERSAVHRLEACNRQLDLLKLQASQVKEERTDLDGQLPQGGRPLVTRVKAAENDLADLEALLPLSVKHKNSQQELEVSRQRVAQSTRRLKVARQRWQEMLLGCGLPGDLSPRQIRHLADKSRSVAEREKQLQYRSADLEQRRRELSSIENRLSSLMEETGIQATSDSPLGMLQLLLEELSNQRQLFARHSQLRHEAKQLRLSHRKLVRRQRKLRVERRNILVDADVSSEQEFRELVARLSEQQLLQHKHEALSEKIETSIAEVCSLETLEKELKTTQEDLLESREVQLHAELAKLQNELGEQYELRGKITEQMKALADDKRLLSARLELGSVECRLATALERWQTLAVTGIVLESIRKIYETQRQPQTLTEASGYLSQLTEGHYTRVWTPLGEDVLRVDDSQGNSLSLEVLSRGTREQVFLSLRLALASAYARRGAILPMILDDVLVNFDAKRAKSAAMVLRDFAKAGHQILVFTCHEHIMKIFKSLRVVVNELPSRSDSGEVEGKEKVLEKKRKNKSPSRKKNKTEKIKEEVQEIDEPLELEPEEQLPAETLLEESDPDDEDLDGKDELDAEDEGEDESGEEELEGKELREEDEHQEIEEDDWEEEEEIEVDAWDDEEHEEAEAA